MLIWPKDISRRQDVDMFQSMGPDSPMANFLRDFGPALLKKYHPKAIVVFSAHWETDGEIQGTKRSFLFQLPLFHNLFPISD